MIKMRIIIFKKEELLKTRKNLTASVKPPLITYEEAVTKHSVFPLEAP